MDENSAHKELNIGISKIQEKPSIQTDGGAVVQGNVITEGGDFAGRDLYKTIITEDTSYDVHGLPNPFLGLRAFNYSDQAAFGGRDSAILEAVGKLADPKMKLALFFITGASGSGKSSFAQAGLLPALEDYYKNRHKQIFRAIFRPSSDPLAMLADSLGLLGLPDLSSQELGRSTPEEFANFLSKNTPGNQVNLLIIDQFEEFFTQSAPGQRDVIFAFLANLPEFSLAHTHFIATLRSDFLDELFKNKELWDIAKKGIELRAMGLDEMKQAIQQPLLAACQGTENGRKKDERYCQKRFDPDLLERLAQDACQEAAYLPLLQVTLQEIWNRGRLKPGEYGSLTTAIQQRAEAVYLFEDFSASNPEKERPLDERVTVLDIFLDLVDVSLDSEVRRDVRRRRAKSELIANSIQREHLVADLIEARLLSASTEVCAEEHVEMVDIIHESLISNWDRLRTAITEQRQDLRRRSRFEGLLVEWLENNRSNDYSLTGVRLAEARELEKEDDIAIRRPEARDFLRRSGDLAEAVQHQKFRRTLYFSVGLSIALIVAIFTAYIAWQQKNLAIQNEAKSQARELAANSIALLDSDPELSLKLAIRSIDNVYTLQGEDALRRVLLSPPVKLILVGHSGTVYSVEYDNKGHRLVTAGEDGTARIWDSTTGQELFVLKGHTKPVLAATFSPNDQLVATVSEDKTVKVWNGTTGNLIRSMAGHEDAVNSVAFSPDGKRMITASDDKTARIWDVETGREIKALSHAMQVRAAVYSPNGDFISTGGYDRSISIWDANTMELIKTFSNGLEVVNAIVFSHNNQFIFADALYSVFRWNIQDGQYDTQYSGSHNWYLTDIALSQNDKVLATASRDHTVRLWDEVSGYEIVTLLGHSEVVFSAAFDPSGDHIATASADQTVRIWDLAEWRKRTLRIVNPGEYTNAAYSNDSTRIATTGSDGWLRIWDALSGTELKAWQYPGWYAARLSFSPDDKFLITASDDGTWRIWEVSSGKQIFVSDYTNIVHDARFSPDGTRIITTDRDGYGYIWDAETKELIETLAGHKGWVASGRFSPDGSMVVTASADHTAKLWDVKTGKEIRTLAGHTELVVKAAFSKDGKRIVTASVDGTARIWDTATGRTLQILKGHTAQLSDATFTPDDRYVVTASADETVRVWDAATGNEIIKLIGHTKQMISLSFSRDGRYLISTSWDGTARIYPVRFEDVVALARSILSNREFTCPEKVKYLHEELDCSKALLVSPDPP